MMIEAWTYELILESENIIILFISIMNGMAANIHIHTSWPYTWASLIWIISQCLHSNSKYLDYVVPFAYFLQFLLFICFLILTMHEYAKQQKDITWKPNGENSHSLASALVRIGIKTISKYFHWFSFHSNIFCVMMATAQAQHSKEDISRCECHTTRFISVHLIAHFNWTHRFASYLVSEAARLSWPEPYSRIEIWIKSKTENIIKLNVHPLSTDSMETNFKNRKIKMRKDQSTIIQSCIRFAGNCENVNESWHCG